MKRPFTFLTVLSLVAGSSLLLSAQDNPVAGPKSPPRAAPQMLAVSAEAKTKVRAGQTVAVFLNGSDILSSRIMEDAVGICLANAGFNVVNRERIERIVGEQVGKMRKEQADGTVNALDVGKAVNADLIVTGTVIIDSVEQKPLVVKIACFQLVEVSAERTLVNALFETDKGDSMAQTSRAFVQIVRPDL
jgi:hypothetical protein